jgi:PadR family transcriptional regulator PadR
LYPALHTLERRGWLRARRRAVSGRTRVYYSLTPAGKRRLGAMNREWRRISSGVQAALGGIHG